MKRLIRSKGIFNCTFKSINKCRIINKRNENITEWGVNKNTYLKSDGIVIASINIDGKLTLYPLWNKTKANLIRVCKFTGISTKKIKNMIINKHQDIIIENNMKLIN